MMFPNIFDAQDVQTYVDRINALTPTTEHLWGKMTVDQMLAHLNIVYDMTYTDTYPAPGRFGKLLARLFAKNIVVGDTPYKKNNPTAPAFKIQGSRDFEVEKKPPYRASSKNTKARYRIFGPKRKHDLWSSFITAAKQPVFQTSGSSFEAVWGVGNLTTYSNPPQP